MYVRIGYVRIMCVRIMYVRIMCVSIMYVRIVCVRILYVCTYVWRVYPRENPKSDVFKTKKKFKEIKI